jgi:hypothetical protein
MTKRLCAFPLLVLLASCERPLRTSDAEFLQLVPQIVAFAEEDARQAAPEGSARGPLFVDPRSFRYWANRQLNLNLDSARIVGAINRPFRPSTEENAVQCANFQLGPTCSVIEDGVFVRLSLLLTEQHRMLVYTTSLVTHQNYIPSAVCERRFELVFTRQNGPWQLAERNPKREC